MDPQKHRISNRKWYLKHRERVLAEGRERYRKDPARFILETTEWAKKNRPRLNAAQNKRRHENPEKYREYMTEYFQKKPEKRLLLAARTRAKKRGIEFSLEEQDIVVPDVCPVLGIKIEKHRKGIRDESPSLDRMDSSKGYTKGNITVISWKANRLKNDGTAEDHRKISDWMDNHGRN